MGFQMDRYAVGLAEKLANLNVLLDLNVSIARGALTHRVHVFYLRSLRSMN